MERMPRCASYLDRNTFSSVATARHLACPVKTPRHPRDDRTAAHGNALGSVKCVRYRLHPPRLSWDFSGEPDVRIPPSEAERLAA